MDIVVLSMSGKADVPGTRGLGSKAEMSETEVPCSFYGFCSQPQEESGRTCWKLSKNQIR